jgi:hypothetical protein
MTTIRCESVEEALMWVKLKRMQGYKGVRAKGRYKDGSYRVVYY